MAGSVGAGTEPRLWHRDNVVQVVAMWYRSGLLPRTDLPVWAVLISTSGGGRHIQGCNQFIKGPAGSILVKATSGVGRLQLATPCRNLAVWTTASYRINRAVRHLPVTAPRSSLSLLLNLRVLFMNEKDSDNLRHVLASLGSVVELEPLSNGRFPTGFQTLLL